MQFGPIGLPELLFIFALALIVFGPRRLPEIGRTIGKLMAELRRGTQEIQRAIDEEVRAADPTRDSGLDTLRREALSVRRDLESVARSLTLAPPVERSILPPPVPETARTPID